MRRSPLRWFVKGVLVLLLCVLGVGFARGWFALSKTPDTDSNKVNINLTVDPDKVKEDAEKVKGLPNEIKKETDKKETEKSGKQEGEKTPDAR